MLPETAAPGAETLPSATVSVERAVGSQLPLFVTIVTFQRPSYGVCAAAGAGADGRGSARAVRDAAHVGNPAYDGIAAGADHDPGGTVQPRGDADRAGSADAQETVTGR